MEGTMKRAANTLLFLRLLRNARGHHRGGNGHCKCCLVQGPIQYASTPLCQSRNSVIRVSYDESYGPDPPATLRNTLPGGEDSAIHNQRHV